MSSAFDLVIATNPADHTAELRLLDASGVQLAGRKTDFRSIEVSRQRAMFDLRNYLYQFVDPGDEDAKVAETGVTIAENVLGEEIFRLLWASTSQRTLRVRLPAATVGDDLLTPALARVPWEIARPSARHPTLGERNLLVRVVHDAREPATQPLELAPGEDLRVLFVFAEARGSRPLAARAERRALERLFSRSIYPQRRVVADFLTHGVTRERLEEQIADRGGYHVVHWSGHGNLNRLELACAGGEGDAISGHELLELFVRAGGFIPRLAFLSACHSGDILRVESWGDFLAVARGGEPVARERVVRGGRDIALDEPPGFTGTAHALLQGGVCSVVAMRYAVSDDYARDLALEFYDALLAHHQPKSAAAALTRARRLLLDPKRHDPDRYDAADHATPVLYGDEHADFAPHPGRSPALVTRDPRLHRITELTAAEHEHFVGRTWELAGLGADFIGSSTGAETTPVALVTGLGGMGKTALASEVLELWAPRFQWVLLYQAKPNPLGFEATLRDLHGRLLGELGRYHDHLLEHPADAIYRPAEGGFTGPERVERLIRNLMRALADEAVLLVLDNFESNLKPDSEPTPTEGGEPRWACTDAAWDACLAALAGGLRGTPSRVLVTSRRPLAALAGICCRVRLGPLAAGEAALYLRAHVGLAAMLFGEDPDAAALVPRVLAASRFHPLLMDRLARLATGGPALRPQLFRALDTLEHRHGTHGLPELFTHAARGADELTYLEDALATSLDALIDDAPVDARCLLWMVAVANDPVGLRLLRSVWSRESYHQMQLRRLGELLERLSDLAEAERAHLLAMPPELRAQVEAFAPTVPAGPDSGPLLRGLVAVGLLTETLGGETPVFSCHELVRERIDAWMEAHPCDRGDWTRDGIRLAYAELLEAEFHAFRDQNLRVAIRAGSDALVYAVQAGDFARLGRFAAGVVNGAENPRVVAELLPHLEVAAAAAPPGRVQLACLIFLADAERVSGRPEVSLAHYEQAAFQARAAVQLEGAEGRDAWESLAVITANWAIALSEVGNLEAARERHAESAEASRKAGRPAVFEAINEIEALRLDIMQNRVREALPQVEAIVARLQGWWREQLAGHAPPDADSPDTLASTLLAALDVAQGAHFAQRDWEAALRRCNETLDLLRTVQRPPEVVADVRMNRAMVLSNLGRHGEAMAELEACLVVFGDDVERRARTLQAMAQVLDAQGDLPQAIIQARRVLTMYEQLSSPHARAVAHNWLAIYLERSTDPAEQAEAVRHLHAALVYLFATGHLQDLCGPWYNFAERFRAAHAAGTTFTVPPVAELIADPAFHALREWLYARVSDTDALQDALSQVLQYAYDSALHWEKQAAAKD